MKEKILNVSIIVPFLDEGVEKMKQFLNANLMLFEQNNIEILLFTMDQTMKQEIIKYIYSNPFFNWKLFYLPTLSKMEAYIKVMSNASYERLLILESSIVLELTVIEKMFTFGNHYTDFCIVGYPITIDFDINSQPYSNSPAIFLISKKNIFNKLLFKKLITIKTIYRVDILRALQSLGNKILVVKNVFSLLGNCNSSLTTRRLPIKNRNRNLVHEANNLVYNYEEKKMLKEIGIKYFSDFDKFKIASPEIFEQKYTVIALVTVYNEKKNLNSFLMNIKQHCDAIILLDDGSFDDSYDWASDEKIILKLKKNRINFNDLENRNILLKCSFFFNAEWILFMDADERLDDRFQKISDIIKKDNVHVYSFNFINIWDEPRYFRDERGDKRDVVNIFKRFRLFRNKGFSQIRLQNDRKLHFATVPYFENNSGSYILVHHLATLNQWDRVEKYNFYNDQDRGITKNSYEYLLDKHVNLKLVSKLQKTDLD